MKTPHRMATTPAELKTLHDRALLCVIEGRTASRTLQDLRAASRRLLAANAGFLRGLRVAP